MIRRYGYVLAQVDRRRIVGDVETSTDMNGLNRKTKVLVAMSGGVDSSVAAALLQRQGHEVIGVFMRLGSPEGVVEEADTCETGKPTKQGCCSVGDSADARRVAGLLGIPFYVANFQADFGRVIDYFVDEYNAGRTPNPCVRCNDWLKFGKLAEYAKALGADFVASGHYARVEAGTGRRKLLRGKDLRKDQSYVLFGMTQEALDHTLLPIGGMEKSEVRVLAEEWGLPVFDKPDSQEICFVPNGDYAGLVRRRTPQAFSDGELIGPEGSVVGRHEGHQHFTIGQRKGVGVAMGYPIYVTAIDAERNAVTLGPREGLLRRSLWADQVNILSDRVEIGTAMRCAAKIRYNHAPQPALATFGADGRLEVTFDDPQLAITPGQAVVVYGGDEVLGGGWIGGAVVSCQ